MKLSISYLNFWALFRNADAVRSDLFVCSRIRAVNHLGRPACITGSNYVASVSRSEGMVQFEIMFNTRKADRDSLLKLASYVERDKNMLLNTLGNSYVFERRENSLTIRKIVQGVGNILDESTWERLSESLVAEVTYLFGKMNPYIQDALAEIYQDTLFKAERRSEAEQKMLPT